MTLWQPFNVTEACATIPAASQLTGCSHFAYVYLNLLATLMGDSHDRRAQENIREYRSKCIKPDFGIWKPKIREYDFVIVGAGSAGCVIANRLSEFQDWKVLLLEAGPEEPDVTMVPGASTSLMGSNLDWAYVTQPNGKSCLARPDQQCQWPRGKTMGGSSSINSMAYIRGNRLDYDTWAQQGNDGWSYEDVLPYFIKSEKNLNIEHLSLKYHGVDGEQSVSLYPYYDTPSRMLVEAFSQAGLPVQDYNGKDQIGVFMVQAFSQSGYRVSTNNGFIRKIRYRRKNLDVKVNSEVTKILIDKNNIAYGVKYVSEGKVYEALATKEVIVSGGSINSPKLLMLSGVGPREHLDELGIPVKMDLAVGKNLHDHITFNGIVVALNNASTLKSPEEILQDVRNYHHSEIKTGPLSANGPGNAIAFIKTDPDLPAPDIQYQVDSCILEEYINNPTDYERASILPKAYYDGIIPRTMNLVPKSRGVLLLNASDPNGAPLLFPNYFDNPVDFVPLIKGVKFLLRLEETEDFKSNGANFVKTPLEACKHLPWGTDEYILCLATSYTSSTYHPVGTCKMGPDRDKNAVVDSRLKVYGISNLRVIDASIMPDVIRGNTNAPSIMIGERGVAFVIEEWLAKSKVCVL